MKKAIIIFMALATFTINAQNKNSERSEQHNKQRENFTPEQKAELHTKKMTLDLNLNETQQTKVRQLFLEMQNNKPATHGNRKEMTDAQKFEAKEAMLDKRIAMKKAMKEILSEEQFIKWEKNLGQKKRRANHKNSREKRSNK